MPLTTKFGHEQAFLISHRGTELTESLYCSDESGALSKDRKELQVEARWFREQARLFSLPTGIPPGSRCSSIVPLRCTEALARSLLSAFVFLCVLCGLERP